MCLTASSQIPQVVLIPKPQQMEIHNGNFFLNKNSSLYYEPEFAVAGNFFQDYLENGAGFQLPKKPKTQAHILIEKDEKQPAEGYSLNISDSRITIKASDASGAFYAIQTLRQLLPVEMEKQNNGENIDNKKLVLPQLSITDFPRFKYRGMHLDVGRHFFDKEFVKKYIANLALLKINTFHWHLTEDQGWRIEIKKYPELTSKGAFREETRIGHYEDKPERYDGKRYGGFYTQDEIREVVDFAKTQNVTIIPEIEMPGHAQAAIHSYPQLGCTGKQIPVGTTWGVFEDIFCPKEETFTFLENVLDEVIALFPGEYIHIGGDEAPKLRWKNCAHCQNLIKEKNLKDEEGLQSYFIHRIEEYVNGKGKKIIGWDEILEGGLAPNATVMSWRGMQGGVDAAKQRHDVIMTPVSHVYFDYYQSENLDEPTAIGGFLPLKKVYSFNPIPYELTEEEGKYIIGAQANVWTEYIPTEKQAEYMVFPRILALSEVVWSGPSKDFDRDYPDFFSRVEEFMKRLDVLDINFANYLYEIEGDIVKKDGKVYYQLTTPTKGKEIRYSINGSKPKTYTEPIRIDKDSKIKANIYKDGKELGRDFFDSIKFHKAIIGDISINVEPNPAYAAGGKEALINGISGSEKRYGDKEWLGFWGDDLVITIDLGKDTDIKSLRTRFFNSPGVWIYAPTAVKISGESSKGGKFSMAVPVIAKDHNLIDVEVDLNQQEKIKPRYITLTIPNYGVIPDGLQGAGHKAWTFIDEIVVE